MSHCDARPVARAHMLTLKIDGQPAEWNDCDCDAMHIAK
jgi:hypothetical protein